MPVSLGHALCNVALFIFSKSTNCKKEITNFMGDIKTLFPLKKTFYNKLRLIGDATCNYFFKYWHVFF